MRSKLKKDEKILLVTRLHVITIITPFVWMILAGLILPSFSNETIVYSVTGFLGLIGLWKILVRQKNLWIVTNKRVIDESGVINLNVKESPLHKINNVDYKQDLMGRMLGYGTILIQTAAGSGATEYDLLEKPAKLKDVITDAIETDRNREQSTYKTYEQIATDNQNQTEQELSAKLAQLKSLFGQELITEEEFKKKKQSLLDNF
ncbi:MAG: PH domain-containing protein [Balneolaceae bacterium]